MKVICVDWEDVTTYGRWNSLKEHTQNPLSQMRTVGILLKSNRQKISVGLSIDDSRDCSDVANIPRGCVRKIEILGKVEWPRRRK